MGIVVNHVPPQQTTVIQANAASAEETAAVSTELTRMSDDIAEFVQKLDRLTKSDKQPNELSHVTVKAGQQINAQIGKQDAAETYDGHQGHSLPAPAAY